MIRKPEMTPEDFMSMLSERFTPLAFIARRVLDNGHDLEEAAHALALGFLALNDDLKETEQEISHWMAAHERIDDLIRESGGR